MPPQTGLLGVRRITLLISSFLHLSLGTSPPRPPIQVVRRPLRRPPTALPSTMGLSLLSGQGSIGSAQVVTPAAITTKADNRATHTRNAPDVRTNNSLLLDNAYRGCSKAYRQSPHGVSGRVLQDPSGTFTSLQAPSEPFRSLQNTSLIFSLSPVLVWSRVVAVWCLSRVA